MGNHLKKSSLPQPEFGVKDILASDNAPRLNPRCDTPPDDFECCEPLDYLGKSEY